MTAPAGAEIETRAVAPGDLAALRALYSRVWQRERTEAYDRMRFIETMHGLPDAATAWSGGELIGSFTLWPLTLTDGSVTVPAGEAMDVMTDDRFRGRGIFPRLAEQATQQAAARGVKLLFGAPNKAIYATYLRRLAWASPGFIRTWVRPLGLDGAVPLGGLATRGFALWPARRAEGYEVRHERPDDGALADCLAAERRPHGSWRLQRTPGWYDFRYREAGRFDYRWVGLWRGQVLAAAVVWGLARDGAARLRRANVADVIGGDVGARQAAVGATVRAAREAGAHFLAATMTSRARGREFCANGFFPYSRSPLIAKTLGADAFAANPFDADSWDLFGGDFDFI